MYINGQNVFLQTGLNWLTLISGTFNTFSDVWTLIKVRFFLEQLSCHYHLMFQSAGVFPINCDNIDRICQQEWGKRQTHTRYLNGGKMKARVYLVDSDVLGNI